MLMTDGPIEASYHTNYLFTACTTTLWEGGTQPAPLACNHHARRTQPQAVLLTCSSSAWQSLALFNGMVLSQLARVYGFRLA